MCKDPAKTVSTVAQPAAGTQQDAMWSSTIPVACINAYAVVGPDESEAAALQFLGHRGAIPG